MAWQNTQRAACPSLFDGHATPGWSPDQRPWLGKPRLWPALAAIRMDRLRFAHPTD